MSGDEWGVFTSPPSGDLPFRTWFAGLRKADLTFAWRSLDTSSRETARQWLASAICHGTNAHTKTCADCAGEEQS